MTTNAILSKDSDLYKKGQDLLLAAQAYWAEYQKHFTRGAVVYLESKSGALVVFTRSEYKRSLMEVVENFEGNSLPENLFTE